MTDYMLEDVKAKGLLFAQNPYLDSKDTLNHAQRCLKYFSAISAHH